MREVDPFDYWAGHSSAIEGLGGSERSPDPRYLFHTGYHEVRPGHARYIIRLNQVSASFGELAIRVHAWKPDSDSGISLVSGSRVKLDGGTGGEISLPVHFAAQKGVQYALYGYLSEDSDVAAQSLRVAIDEPEHDSEVLLEPPRSVLAVDRQAEEMRPANALLYAGRVELDQPVSQSCTAEQAAAVELMHALPGWDRAVDSDAVIKRWSETLCLKALTSYGAGGPGLEGLVVGPVSADLMQRLAGSSSVAHLPGGLPPPLTSSDFIDFLLMPAGISFEVLDAPERWRAVAGWLARLKIGGLAVLGLRYRAARELTSSPAAAEALVLSRNEVAQWALRLIGSGYSVAPLAFGPAADLVTDDSGLAGFVLIIQRS